MLNHPDFEAKTMLITITRMAHHTVWPTISQALIRISKESFQVDNPNKAEACLTLALLALEIQVCRNTLSEKVAQHFIDSIAYQFSCLNDLSTAERKWMKDKFLSYVELVKNTQRGPYAPVYEDLSSDLLREWLGANITYHLIGFNERKGKVLNPATIGVVSHILIQTIIVLNEKMHFWDKIRDGLN